MLVSKDSADAAEMAALLKASPSYCGTTLEGTLPKVMIERQTVFGAFVGLVVILGFIVLATFLILNWYYSPVMISSNVPFGLTGVADPIANFSMRYDMWGWTGTCTCDASMFTVTGVGFGSSGTFSVLCAPTTYSCGMDVEIPTAVLSSLGTLAFAMPSAGNAMGVSYIVTMTPSLNASAPQTVSQTVWAGSEEVFGGPVPLVLSLATTWSRLEDETRGENRQGFIVSPAGTSPGSTLNNETYLNADKTFRASVVLNRGTTFLNIRIAYVTSLALLIGAIFGYFGGLMAVGRGIMRVIESLHQRKEDPNSVKAYLTAVGGDNTSTMRAVDTVNAVEMAGYSSGFNAKEQMEEPIEL